MSSSSPKIDSSWHKVLSDEFDKDYFKELKKKWLTEKKEHIVYPPANNIFSAFNRTSFEAVKVIILGQDPYHGPGQANGLSFSVPKGVVPPPSLKNIFRELNQDLGIYPPDHGDLQKWADQGVLLLNAFLTVRHKMPASHRKLGWEYFSNEVIRQLSAGRKGLVFLLWGNFARSKKNLIDPNRHYVLEAAHPSPLSAHQGFFGCRHFSRTNEILENQGISPIDWQL